MSTLSTTFSGPRIMAIFRLIAIVPTYLHITHTNIGVSAIVVPCNLVIKIVVYSSPFFRAIILHLTFDPK